MNTDYSQANAECICMVISTSQLYRAHSGEHNSVVIEIECLRFLDYQCSVQLENSKYKAQAFRLMRPLRHSACFPLTPTRISHIDRSGFVGYIYRRSI